jgi:predicted nucleotidyltransferase
LERAVLFGSRARGEARPDSDCDVAVFIRDPDRWFDEVIRLASLGTDILMDTDAVISAKPFPAGAYNDPVPLMREIKREGLDLWTMPHAISSRHARALVSPGTR